jgi:hypothetical protein
LPERKEQQGDHDQADQIKRVSPVSSFHERRRPSSFLK